MVKDKKSVKEKRFQSFSISLPTEKRKKIESLAKAENRSLSGQIVQAIDDMLKSRGLLEE